MSHKGSDLDDVMLPYKNVRWFDVPVNDVVLVQVLQAFADLYEILPDHLLQNSAYECYINE